MPKETEVKSDKKYEEMVRRVKEIADYAIEHRVASTIHIAEYFTENRFPISNATVCVYLSQRLPEIDPERYEKVKPLINCERVDALTQDSSIIRKPMGQSEKHEEMIRCVKEVADYAIGYQVVSTRQIAKYFSENRFRISNATVCVYLSQRLPQIDPVRYALVKPLIDKNTPKTIETVEVRKRIYSAVALLLRGLTIPQIIEEMNASRMDDEKVTFDIIYDDLTRRLKSIEKDQAIIEDVRKRLSENRMDTLNNQGINGPNLAARTQARTSHGRFGTTVEDTASPAGKVK